MPRLPATARIGGGGEDEFIDIEVRHHFFVEGDHRDNAVGPDQVEGFLEELNGAGGLDDSVHAVRAMFSHGVDHGFLGGIDGDIGAELEGGLEFEILSAGDQDEGRPAEFGLFGGQDADGPGAVDEDGIADFNFGLTDGIEGGGGGLDHGAACRR